MNVQAQDLPDDPVAAMQEYLKMRQASKHSGTKQFSKTEQLKMDDYCFAMQRTFPDAWQTDLMWYINAHYIELREDKLFSAYQKNSKDALVLKHLYGYYALTNNTTELDAMAPKIANLYSKNTLNYYEQVLPVAGVLIVSSDEEALPLYVLKYGRAKGKNVTIVNMDYLINSNYRKRMSAKLGTGSTEFFGNEANFIKQALQNTGVHLSTTVSQAYLDKCASSTYLTGLTYQGSYVDQKLALEGFYSKLLKQNIQEYSLNSSEKKLYTNYLPPLLNLYKIKSSTGEERLKLKQVIEAIATKVGQTKTVKTILTDYDNG